MTEKMLKTYRNKKNTDRKFRVMKRSSKRCALQIQQQYQLQSRLKAVDTNDSYV